jgi:periplasmic protein TonB
MQAIDDLKAVLQGAKTGGRRHPLTATDEKQRLSSPLRLVRCDRAEAEFGFLRSHAPAPFAVRLALELSEAVVAIRRDPLGFISASPESGAIPDEKRKGMRAGIVVAVAFYVATLSGIYASYAIFHHVKSSAAPAPHLQITYLAPPPAPAPKAAAQLKGIDAGIRKGQLTAAIKPAEQHNASLKEARPTPPAPDQPLNRTEPTTVHSEPYSPTGETSSRVSAPDGVARGLTGTGVGTASDVGRSGVLGAEVNYNSVFSISSVTTRPQILARPIPGYTEEARRAQVEGAVRLSVVLNANGTVSDIKVARALGYGLDEKAVEAAKELRFTPAQKDGHVVSVRVFIEFKFTIL